MKVSTREFKTLFQKAVIESVVASANTKGGRFIIVLMIWAQS